MGQRTICTSATDPITISPEVARQQAHSQHALPSSPVQQAFPSRLASCRGRQCGCAKFWQPRSSNQRPHLMLLGEMTYICF